MSETDTITLGEISKNRGKIPYSERPSIEVGDTKLNFELEEKARKLDVELYASVQFLRLQREWASHIKLQIWFVLLFQVLFVILIGFNLGHFMDNISRIPYLYVGVILQNLANIIALGFVVAQFLFPKKGELSELKKK